MTLVFLIHRIYCFLFSKYRIVVSSNKEQERHIVSDGIGGTEPTTLRYSPQFRDRLVFGSWKRICDRDCFSLQEAENVVLIAKRFAKALKVEYILYS